MSTRLNNVSFRLNGASYRAGIPVPVGTIFRITNFNGDISGNVVLDYTNMNNQISSTGIIGIGQKTYILAKSASLNEDYDAFSGLLIASLGINTINVGENLNFTEQLITTTGAGSWTKPAGVTQVIVQCFGAGGAGGGATLNGQGGNGGGGGGYAESILSYSSAEQTISYSIGTGGIGSIGTGGTGGDTTWNTNTVIAKGSTGGEANANGLGGSTLPGSLGDIIRDGGGGGGSFNDGFGNIGQGSGGASGGNTSFSGQAYLGVDVGGSSLEGAFTTISLNGSVGNIYGGGGSAAVKISGINRTGGNGARGAIRLIYR